MKSEDVIKTSGKQEIREFLASLLGELQVKILEVLSEKRGSLEEPKERVP